VVLCWVAVVQGQSKWQKIHENERQEQTRIHRAALLAKLGAEKNFDLVPKQNHQQNHQQIKEKFAALKYLQSERNHFYAKKEARLQFQEAQRLRKMRQRKAYEQLKQNHAQRRRNSLP
jgi:vacuolar-type H+-ATPase subunit I/STV1